MDKRRFTAQCQAQGLIGGLAAFRVSGAFAGRVASRRGARCDYYISPELATLFGSLNRVVFITVRLKCMFRRFWHESGIADRCQQPPDQLGVA